MNTTNIMHNVAGSTSVFPCIAAQAVPISTHPIPIIRELRRRWENMDCRGAILLDIWVAFKK